MDRSLHPAGHQKPRACATEPKPSFGILASPLPGSLILRGRRCKLEVGPSSGNKNPRAHATDRSSLHAPAFRLCLVSSEGGVSSCGLFCSPHLQFLLLIYAGNRIRDP